MNILSHSRKSVHFIYFDAYDSLLPPTEVQKFFKENYIMFNYLNYQIYNTLFNWRFFNIMVKDCSNNTYSSSKAYKKKPPQMRQVKLDINIKN